MNHETVTVYLAKYALSKGVIETQMATIQLEIIEKKKAEGFKYPLVHTVLDDFYSYFWDKEIFLTKEEAITKAEEMRIKKLKSLEKYLDNLKKRDFSKIKTN
jgi:hypothetical protein